MSNWIFVIAYAVGWVLAVGPTLKRRMTQKMCKKCGHRCWNGNHQFNVVRGSMRDRNGVDALLAIVYSFYWLPWLISTAIAITIKDIGWLILHTAPLTQPEKDRIAKKQEEILKQQELETKKLEKEIIRGWKDGGWKDA